jgi:hypothetical protein
MFDAKNIGKPTPCRCVGVRMGSYRSIAHFAPREPCEDDQ